MMSPLPDISQFEVLEETDGLIQVHDKAHKVWVKVVSWPLKGGSPYNGANNNTISVLNRRSVPPKILHSGKLGARTRRPLLCVLPDPLDSRKTVNVFTFVSTGVNLWLVLMWAQDCDWKQIHAYTDQLFKSVYLYVKCLNF